MPTPLGHGIIGLAVYAAFTYQPDRQEFLTKKEIGICLLCSFAPDLDFIPGVIAGDHFGFHHGGTHSLTFGIVFGIILAAVLGKFRPETFWKGASIYTLLVWIHDFLDISIVDKRPIKTAGLQLFYPFSREWFKSPINIFFVDLGSKGSIHPKYLLTPHNLYALAMEILAAAGLGFIVYKGILLLRKRFDSL